MRIVLLAALATLPASCLSGSYGRTNRDEPLPLAYTSELVPGQTGLGACLAAFGAPRWVLEHPVANGDGAVLLWGWLDEADFGLSLSVPLGEQSSVNFDYRQLDARTRGLVLFFDERWILTDWRAGLLAVVARDLRPRPAFLEEDA
jgi:hypothetical protein